MMCHSWWPAASAVIIAALADGAALSASRFTARRDFCLGRAIVPAFKGPNHISLFAHRHDSCAKIYSNAQCMVLTKFQHAMENALLT
jgi:hypothetical protein